MSRCFIFEPTDFDVTELNDLGQVIYIFPKGSFRRPLRDQLLELEIGNKLDQRGFIPQKDFIVLTGSQAAVTIFATTAVSVYGPIRTLMFDAITRKYQERSLGHLHCIDTAEHGYGVA